MARAIAWLVLLHSALGWRIAPSSLALKRLGRPTFECRSHHLLASASLECETAEGAALAATMTAASDSADARREWELGLEVLAERWGTGIRNATVNGDLAARVTELRELTRDRDFVVDCLRLRVLHVLDREAVKLLGTLGDVAPGVAVPPSAVTLDVAKRTLPAEAYRQLEVFLTESAPSNDPHLNGRFDRLQGAQLYMGHVQFGYFLAQVFCGTAHLGEQQVVSASFARRIEAEIEAATRGMKTDAAWIVASQRAGDFFELSDAEEPSPCRHEDLREFTTGVHVVGGGLVEEFFDTTEVDTPGADISINPLVDQNANIADESAHKEAAPSIEGDNAIGKSLPRASFVRFNAAGLQALCCEGCVIGYLLWGAEWDARFALGEASSSQLMPPPPG
eukprot:scaffold159607_cov31-Tisochrysis_lutea.AAC.1